MKAIIYNTIDEFNSLNERINNALYDNIQGYNAIKWCEPIINTVTNEYACPLETEGLRGAIILGFVLTNEEKVSMVDISQDDENWFPKSDILGGLQ
jgi:hypothetical protein